MSNAPSIATEAQLTVKELSYALGKSDHYIYQMHHCGFPMQPKTFPESNIAYLTATLSAARDWIATNDFRLVDGFGVTGGYQYFLPIQLQAENWTHNQTVLKRY